MDEIISDDDWMANGRKRQLAKLSKANYKLPDPSEEARNEFTILENWSKAAKDAGWPERQIKTACDMAMGKDYEHLLKTIQEYSQS